MRVPLRTYLRPLAGWIVLALVLAPAGWAALRTPATHPDSESPDGALVTARAANFRISGKVSGLYPGVQRTMKVKVKNLGSAPIRITQITAKASSPNVQCAGNNVKITEYKAKKGKKKLVVKPHKTRKLKLPITMSAAAPDACQGATFPLAFKGKAGHA